jgi:serine/threonine protein kinase
MTATKESLASLPPLQRRMAEAWLTRFEDGWHTQKLSECMQALPSQSILRRPLLLAMIERDMAYHWQEGRAALVENYLHDYSELGSVEEIPIELIVAEYQQRQKNNGNADLTEFAERFPSRIDDLYLILKPGLFDAPAKPAPAAPQDLLQKRLKLLQAPAQPETAPPLESGGDRLSKLLSSPAPNAPKEEAELPASLTKTPSDFDDETAGSVDIFNDAETATGQATNSMPVQPAESVWLDVETLRESEKNRPPRPTAREFFTPPQSFGRYTIEKKILSGSQASIYEARDSQIERRVVIKTPDFPTETAEAARAIFHRECRTAATIFHPALCPIYDVGQHDGIDFVVMPFVEGESLDQMLKRQPVWPSRQAVYLALKLASALDVAHRQGVVHRDLRPSHVLLTTSEIPVLVGFGRAGRPQAYDDPDAAAYVAPEVLSDSETGGPRSDVYGLGVILQRLVTGTLPGQASETAEPRKTVETDRALSAIIRKATSPRADDRYGSMRDLLLELNHYMKSSNSMSDITLPDSLQPLQSGSNDVRLTNADGGSATQHLSEIRRLTENQKPARRATAHPHARKSVPWVWYVASAVVGAVLMLTVLMLGNRNSQSGGNVKQGPSKKSNGDGVEPKLPANMGIEELSRRLMASTPGDARDQVVRQIRERENTQQDKAYLRDRLIEDIWPENTTGDTNGKRALLKALTVVDLEEAITALERAASIKTTSNENLRLWACSEATEFAESEQLEPRWRNILLNALSEDTSKVRCLAAQALRKLPPEDKTVEVLMRRIKDDNWVADIAGASKGRLDESRVAALETLSRLEPERVKEALNAAKKSRNPRVRGWAFEAFREKFPADVP